MKKSVLSIICLAAISVGFSACTTVSLEDTVETEMKSEKLVINSIFNRNDFVLLDTVSGSSDFVTYDCVTKKITGDSFKYGVIAEPENLVVDVNLAVCTGKKAGVLRSNALEIAKQNANYELIMEADELGADTLIEPMYTIEKKAEYVGNSVRKESYKVTVKAKALKVKRG